ncbi:MAG: hypothetical protein B6D64_12440 [Bacteroidetes bacterium 4484_276]|jgi:hypothetical protein|nr:MAG: hypothetical protein B6D64_12440 [Bacteroidetes bacterium 4484_276]
MKIKFNTHLLTLLAVAITMVFALNQCKNVGPSDWPEPTPDASNQLKMAVFNGDNGTSIQGYDIKVILPDGTTQEFDNENGTLTIPSSLEGNYVITASKEGFLAESAIVEIEMSTEDNVSTVTQQQFFLSKKSNGVPVTPQGTVITAENNLEQPTTIEFPSGSLQNDQEISVSFIQPPAKHGDLKIIGERVIVKGYNFTPDLTFPENALPTINIPVEVQAVKDGAPLYFGTYDMDTQSWEMIEGTMNGDRTVASFEMPHFSDWYAFTGFRLVKSSVTWSSWEYVAESDTCSSGACGTFVYAVTPTPLVTNLISLGYNINLKVKDVKCVGPHYKYAQVLYARCRIVTYDVYDYTGQIVGSIQVPQNKFQWMIDEYYCHDQGGGN